MASCHIDVRIRPSVSPSIRWCVIQDDVPGVVDRKLGPTARPARRTPQWVNDVWAPATHGGGDDGAQRQGMVFVTLISRLARHGGRATKATSKRGSRCWARPGTRSAFQFRFVAAAAEFKTKVIGLANAGDTINAIKRAAGSGSAERATHGRVPAVRQRRQHGMKVAQDCNCWKPAGHG
jgi:hypothetical protein